MATDEQIEDMNGSAVDEIIELSNQAEDHADSQEWDQAVELRQETIQLCERHLGLDHGRTLLYKTLLAFYFRAQGQYPSAEGLDRDVLERRRRVLGEDHVDSVKSMNNLALDLKGQGHYDEGMELELQAVNVLVAIRGEDDEATVTSTHNLANSYAQARKYDEAAVMHQRVLEARIRTLGKANVQTIAAMDMLAVDSLSLGDTGRAQQLQEEAVQLATTHFGLDDDCTLKCLTNLAITYRKSGEAPAQWTNTLEAAISASRKPGQDDTPATVGIMNALGMAYVSDGRLEDTKPLFEDCYAWSRRVLGPNHPQTNASRQNLEYVLTRLGELVKAPIFG